MRSSSMRRRVVRDRQLGAVIRGPSAAENVVVLGYEFPDPLQLLGLYVPRQLALDLPRLEIDLDVVDPCHELPVV